MIRQCISTKIRPSADATVDCSALWEDEMARGNEAFAAGCYSAALEHFLHARTLCTGALDCQTPCPDWLAAYGATTANIAHCWASIGLPDQANEALTSSMRWLRTLEARFQTELQQTVVRKLFHHWQQLNQCRWFSAVR